MKYLHLTSICIAIILPFATCAQSKTDAAALATEYYFKKDWSKAKPLLEKALGDTSKSALLWQRAAYTNLMLGKDDLSVMQYTHALSLGPNPNLRNIIQAQLLSIYDKQNNANAAVVFVTAQSDNGFNNMTMLDTLPALAAFRKAGSYAKIREKIKINSFPCMTEPHRNDFDFWVGEWNVYPTGTDNLAGHSVITKQEGNCSITEAWQSLVTPNTGQSINYFDPAKGTWEQVYVGSGGGLTRYTDGVYKDAQMHFTYQAVFQGTPYTGNFIFYNQGSDQVRQFQDYTVDGGKTYVTTTDLTYKRVKKK